jgi:hypothetical protein
MTKEKLGLVAIKSNSKVETKLGITSPTPKPAVASMTNVSPGHTVSLHSRSNEQKSL